MGFVEDLLHREVATSFLPYKQISRKADERKETFQVFFSQVSQTVSPEKILRHGWWKS
jgi:hypothetical protein